MSETSEQTIAGLQQKIKDLELQLKKAKDNSGYGLKREEKPEIFEERAQNALPVLKEDKNLLIDNKSDLDHIIIEGDNYHALSALNYTHKGKIDVIYIDPPYNTGNKDFIYNDNYVDPEDTYRHSKWISFMNKRLRLAKNLLTEDGVIFISIDDNEQSNLKLLCDEIFGEDNYISLYPRLTVKGGKTQTSLSTSNCDYILGYAKNKKIANFNKISMENDPAFKYSDKYVSKRGKYHTKQALDTISLGYIKSLDYPIEHDGVTYYPGGSPEQNGFRRTWSKEKYEFAIKNDFVEFKNGRIFPKKYMNASIEKDSNGYYIEYVDKEKNYSQLEFIDNRYSNANGNGDLKNLGLSGYFSYPKSVSLINDLLMMSSKKNSLIIDFFAGSGTTGQAILGLNKNDGGHRQFILCSNREKTKDNPNKNICKDITYERVKRVLKGYRNEKGENVEGIGGGNLRYYTTEFIQNKKSTDDLRQSFIYLCDELLCIKEDTFNEYKSEFLSSKLRCYHKNNHYTVILYDIREMEKLQNLISKIDGEISVYIFSLSGDSCEEELQQFSNKITIENIPDDILETYKKIF